MGTTESPPFALKHLKSGHEPFGRTRIFKDEKGRELNDCDGSGASGCGLRQSGWALEHRGLQWDGLGCCRAFVVRLRPGDCWGLGETTDDSPSLVSISKPSAPPCPAGLDLVPLFSSVTQLSDCVSVLFGGEGDESQKPDGNPQVVF